MQNLIVNPDQLTMSSREISELVEKRHDNVRRAMDALGLKGLITVTQTEEPTPGGGKPVTVYRVNKRDSYVVVAQLSPEFTARLVDRWQELEQQSRLGFDPNNEIEVLENLLITKKQLAQQAALLEQTAAERDQAIKTKAQISSSREASVMGKLSAASRKINKLEGELGFNTRHASIIAVENATGRKFGKQGWRPLKKWCEQRGLSAVSVPCQRWGTAKAWPALAWNDVYSVDLVELFGGAA